MNPVFGIQNDGWGDFMVKCLGRVDDELCMLHYELRREDGQPDVCLARFGPWSSRLRAMIIRDNARNDRRRSAFDASAWPQMRPSDRVWTCALNAGDAIEFIPAVPLRDRYVVSAIDLRGVRMQGEGWRSEPIVILACRTPPLCPPHTVCWEDGWTPGMHDRPEERWPSSGAYPASSLRLVPAKPFDGPFERADADESPGVARSLEEKVAAYFRFVSGLARQLLPAGVADARLDEWWAARSAYRATPFSVMEQRRPPSGVNGLLDQRTVLIRCSGAWGGALLDPRRTDVFCMFGPWFMHIRRSLAQDPSLRVGDLNHRYIDNRQWVPENERMWSYVDQDRAHVEFFTSVRHRGRRVHCFPPFYERRADASWDVGPGKAKFWVVRYIDEDRWRSDAAYLAELRGLEREGWRFDLNEPGVVPAFIEGLIAEGDLEFIAGPPPEGPTGLVETD